MIDGIVSRAATSTTTVIAAPKRGPRGSIMVDVAAGAAFSAPGPGGESAAASVASGVASLMNSSSRRPLGWHDLTQGGDNLGPARQAGRPFADSALGIQQQNGGGPSDLQMAHQIQVGFGVQLDEPLRAGPW